MPRNITLTFADGTSHVYQNAPDDVTPDQVYARAQKEFSGKQITNLDGGRQAAPAAQAQPGLGEGGSYRTALDSAPAGGMDRMAGGRGPLQKKTRVNMTQVQDVVGAPGTRPKDKAAAYAADVTPRGNKATEPFKRFTEEFTLGLPGQIRAGTAAIGGAMEGLDPGEVYNASRARQAEITKENAGPAATAGGVAGGLASMMVGSGEVGAATKGQKLLPRIGAAAREGMEAGARYGAATGATGSQRYQDIPKNTLRGGTLGAATGGALGGGVTAAGAAAKPAFKAAGGLWEWLDRSTGSHLIPVDKSSLKLLREAHVRDQGANASPAATDKFIKQISKTGFTPEVLDHAGKHVMALFREAFNQAHGGTKAAEDLVSQQTARGQKLESAASEAGSRSLAKTKSGLEAKAVEAESKVRSDAMADARALVKSKKDLPTLTKDARELRRRTAARLYAPLKDVSVDVTPLLSTMSGKTVETMLRKAAELAEFDANTHQAGEFQNLLNLIKLKEEANPAELAAYLKQHPQTLSADSVNTFRSALKDLAHKETDANGQISNLGRIANERAADVSKALEGVPQAAKANAAYREHSEIIDALDMGTEILKAKSPADFKADWSRLSGNKTAQDAARTSVARRLEEAINGNSESTLARFRKDGNLRDTMTTMFGQAEADRMATRADQHLAFLKTSRAVATAAESKSQLTLQKMAEDPDTYKRWVREMGQAKADQIRARAKIQMERIEKARELTGGAPVSDPKMHVSPAFDPKHMIMNTVARASSERGAPPKMSQKQAQAVMALAKGRGADAVRGMATKAKRAPTYRNRGKQAGRVAGRIAGRPQEDQ